MNHQTFIIHVTNHYFMRDLKRQEMNSQFVGRSHGFRPAGTSMVDYDGNIIRSDYDNTRRSLERCKPTTVEYLHALLHAEPMRDADVHQHIDLDDMRYIIEEEGDLWTAKLA